MKDWKELLQHARSVGADKIPAGFKSRAELQIQFSLGQAQTGTIIRELLADGKLECRNFRVQTRAGVRPVPHYKIK